MTGVGGRPRYSETRAQSPLLALCAKIQEWHAQLQETRLRTSACASPLRVGFNGCSALT